MAEYIITGIEPVKRKKGWFELTLRGKPPFFIDEENIIKNSITTGEILSEAMLNKIRRSADIAWLKYRAMQILNRRMISERDLRKKLIAERRSKELCDVAIAKLKEYGFIDDIKYAQAYIRSQLNRGAKSKLYLKKKLWEKGNVEDTAVIALSTELAEYDEISEVIRLAEKKFKTLKSLPKEKAKNRLVNFLKGRGFRWDTIRTALDAVLSENGES